MIRSSNLNFREPQVLVRAALGVLLAANLVVAAFAFHLVGESPNDLDAQLASLRSTFRSSQQHLNKSRGLVRNMDIGRDQGNKFEVSYMTPRRHTFGPLDEELNRIAKDAGMKIGTVNYSLPDPIEGSSDLSMLTITAGFEGGYPQLMKLVNAFDRSPRFLLIDSLQVAPQPKGDVLDAVFRINTFVREEPEAAQ
ncbi:MAG TPA: GspMb/PilO family protein [Bryobacteraceae bacterium]|jgi:Tfp pilus assembly protein PilO